MIVATILITIIYDLGKRLLCGCCFLGLCFWTTLELFGLSPLVLQLVFDGLGTCFKQCYYKQGVKGL